MILPLLLARRAPEAPLKPVGPTAGLIEDPAAFLARHADIAELLAQRKSIRCIEKATGKARNTVLKVKRMILDTPPVT